MQPSMALDSYGLGKIHVHGFHLTFVVRAAWRTRSVPERLALSGAQCGSRRSTNNLGYGLAELFGHSLRSVTSFWRQK